MISKNVESRVFLLDINGVKVEFKSGELPNDMKFFGFLEGRLTNAAHYILTFANVNKNDQTDVKKMIGFDKRSEMWEMFPYEKHLEDAGKIATKKK